MIMKYTKVDKMIYCIYCVDIKESKNNSECYEVELK